MNINNVFKSPLLYILIIVIGGGYWVTNYLSMKNNVVSVLGYADMYVKTQVASFSVGVSSTNDKKEIAVKEVNDQIENLTNSVKLFGISADDIKTESISVYQQSELYYEYRDDGTSTQKNRSCQWNVSNSISIKLRDVDNLQS